MTPTPIALALPLTAGFQRRKITRVFRRQILRVLKRRLIVPTVVVSALGVAACSSGDGTITSSTSIVDVGSSVATTEVVTRTSSSDDATRVLSGSVDQALLDEQVDVVVFPDDQGAAMVAVVQDDGSIIHASRGSDPDGNPPAPDSPFRIGSVTKVFTSLLTLTLVDEGIVELEAVATDYVSRVHVPPGVTVRDLLQHTSGVPNYTEVPGFLDGVFSDPDRAWLPEETVAVVEDTEPLFEPGERFSYSNTNYSILGVLVEEVTGRSYAEELRARIIDPLGLDSTYVAGFEDGASPFGAYASTSFSGPSKSIDFDYTSIATNAWAAGAVVSSAGDLHAVLKAVFAGEVISSDSLAAMTENPEYGLGLVKLGPGLYGHAGGIPGYNTFVAHAPDTGITAFFVVTNDSVTTPPPADPILERITQS